MFNNTYIIYCQRDKLLIVAYLWTCCDIQKNLRAHVEGTFNINLFQCFTSKLCRYVCFFDFVAQTKSIKKQENDVFTSPFWLNKQRK